MKNICDSAFAYIKAPAPDRESALVLSEQDSPVLKDLGGGILSAYLLDKGGSFEYVQRKDLASDGITLDALHETAVTNLESRAKSSMQVQAYGPIYVVLMGGNFEASLLLSDRLWERGLNHLVQHGFAAAAPARDVLAFCDSDSPAGLAELQAVISRVSGGDHALFGKVLFRVGSQWQFSAAA